MKINTSKNNVVVISSSQKDRHCNPDLLTAGDPIEVVQEFRFLCVTILSDLRFKKHVDNLVAKCNN